MKPSRIVAALALAALAAACGRGSGSLGTGAGPTTSTPASPSPSVAGTSSVRVFYLVEGKGNVFLAPEDHPVTRTRAVARAAMDELVLGTPQDPDHRRPFPDAARVLGVRIAGGVATVDWNAAVLVNPGAGAQGESRAIQAAVWTLTRFSSVHSVRFTVEGKESGTASNGRTIEDFWGHVGLSGQPFEREDPIDVLESVTILSPSDGEQVGNEVRATGEASVFEANVTIRLYDETGKLRVKDFVTATEGAPGRGTWEIHIPLNQRTLGGPPPASLERWRLEAVEVSMEDGSDFFVEDRAVIVGPLD